MIPGCASARSRWADTSGTHSHEHGTEVLGPEPRARSSAISAIRSGCVDFSTMSRDEDGTVGFERSELRLHSAQSGLLLGDALLDLVPSGTQHRHELLERWIVVEQLADPFEAEAQVAERDHPVQSLELGDSIEAVSALRVHAIRAQDAELVVVAERSRRHLAEPGEISDAQHDVVTTRASPSAVQVRT